MKSRKSSRRNIITIIPTIGIISFVGLYIFSSTLYPGGTQVDLSSVGFDWVNNYWCNLMSASGMNGLPNRARPYSILATIILCISLMVFFVQFAEEYSKNIFWKRTIELSGIISMTFATFVFTRHHDMMIIVASGFGLVTVVGIIREIYLSKLRNYKMSGIFCIFLLGINNYIYYSKYLIEALPLLQKFTFVVVLTWIVGLNFKVTRNIIYKGS